MNAGDLGILQVVTVVRRRVLQEYIAILNLLYITAVYLTLQWKNQQR